MLALSAPACALECLPPQYSSPIMPASTRGVDGTFVEVTGDGWGYAAGWLCPAGVSASGVPLYIANSGAALHSYKTDKTHTALALAVRSAGPDMLAAVNAFLAQVEFVPAEGTPARTNYDRLHATAQARAMALAPPYTPPVKVWAVAVNGAYKTRQWYAYANGVRATAGGGSVEVGLPCDLGMAVVVEGDKTFAAFAPTYRADRVTLCEQK